MSISNDTFDELTPGQVLGATKTDQNARQIYGSIVNGWDLPETYIGTLGRSSMMG